MSDQIMLRRAFLIGALLAGTATLVSGVESLAAPPPKYRRRRRRHRFHKYHRKLSPTPTPAAGGTDTGGAETGGGGAGGAGSGGYGGGSSSSSGGVRSSSSSSSGGGSSGGGSSGGGSSGGGSSGGGWSGSDRRLKTNIRRVGASPSGLPIYVFRYRWGGPLYQGVMAQDLLRLRPDAVKLARDGYLRVDYSRIDVAMRVFEAGEMRCAA